nr:unnamed protein product [Ipomoea trifida]
MLTSFSHSLAPWPEFSESFLTAISIPVGSLPCNSFTEACPNPPSPIRLSEEKLLVAETTVSKVNNGKSQSSLPIFAPTVTGRGAVDIALAKSSTHPITITVICLCCQQDHQRSSTRSGTRHDQWLSFVLVSCLISSLLPFRSTRIPLSLRISLPEVLFSGVSLLATQTTSLVGILLYQMPTYRFLDFPGLKNPSSKLPPAETMTVTGRGAVDIALAKSSTHPIMITVICRCCEDHQRSSTRSGTRHDQWLSSGLASSLVAKYHQDNQNSARRNFRNYGHFPLSQQDFLSTRIPLSLSNSLPEVLFSGVSLLATQTTSFVGILLYQMPTYRFLDFPGLKNPSSKFPPAETMVVPSVMGFLGFSGSSSSILCRIKTELFLERRVCLMRPLSPIEMALFSNFDSQKETCPNPPSPIRLSEEKLFVAETTVSKVNKGNPLMSIISVYSPAAGSSALFHEAEFSELWSFPSLTTRFPVSESRATGFFKDVDEFDDQISSLLPFRSTRIPLSLSNSLPEVLFSGVSLLATQTTSLLGILLYQMPTYRFLDFPGLKNPSSKFPPAETMVVPSVMG